MVKWNQSIPLTQQTDPSRFPQWVENAGRGESGCPYPKALNRICRDEVRQVPSAGHHTVTPGQKPKQRPGRW